MIEAAPQNGAGGDRGTPTVASTRSYLRGGLPAIYHQGDFGMRFLEALETVLDPIVALLDGLPSHFAPALAPEDILTLLGHWLGLDHYETRPVDARRQLLRLAADLASSRGTKAGLELALRLNFPDIPTRVEDQGAVRYATTLEGGEAAAGAGFVVYCDKPLPEPEQREVARFIARQKPAHVPFKLKVRAPRSGSKSA
jgi:phage tail-like protein